MAVRSFPVAAPEEGIAVVDVDGKELLWIPHLNLLSDTVRVNVLRAIDPARVHAANIEVARGKQFCNTQHLGH